MKTQKTSKVVLEVVGFLFLLLWAMGGFSLEKAGEFIVYFFLIAVGVDTFIEKKPLFSKSPDKTKTG